MAEYEQHAVKVARILLPTDYSPGAEAAVAWARELSRLMDAEVTVMHVIEPRQWMPEPHEESQARLDTLAAHFPRARTLLVDGSPGEMIVEIGDREADLIVMGTHGRSGFKRLLMGSVAEYVVRNARTPVLTIRMEAASAQAA